MSLVRAAISYLDYFSSLLIALSASPLAHLDSVLDRVSRENLVSALLKRLLFWHPVASQLILLKNQSHGSDLKHLIWSDPPSPLWVHLLLLFFLICSSPAPLACLLSKPGFLPFEDLCYLFSLPAVLFPQIPVCIFLYSLCLLKCHILSIKNMVNNIVITLYRERWLLDSPRWSFHNACKCQITV